MDQRPIDKEHQLKAFEVDEDQYVVMQPEELDALQPESGRAIEVMAFAPAKEIDPRYFGRSYFLGPDGHAKKYALLAQALNKEKCAGICQWVMRKKSYLGAVRAAESGLLSVVTLNRADEVVEVSTLGLPDAQVSEKELQTAHYLINTLSEEFQPEKYQNEYQDRLRELINKKAKGEAVKLKAPKTKKPTESDQLLKMLEESVKIAERDKKAA